MSDLQFPHASAAIVDKDGRWTQAGHRFALGLWERTGSGQTPAVNAAVSGTADGTYSGNEQTLINDLVALVNQMRQTLVDNGLIQ